MLSVKIFFLVHLVALAVVVVVNAEVIQESSDTDEPLTCDAHGKMITGEKTCIMKCTIGCTSVGCGLFKRCEKLVGDGNIISYKCHCNFGL